MDHIPSPQNPYKPLRVQLLSYSLYDGLCFADFPVRGGWDLEKLERGDLEGRSPFEVASFLQKWLWFGLLASACSTCGVKFQPGDYLCTEDGRSVHEILEEASKRRSSWGWRSLLESMSHLLRPEPDLTRFEDQLGPLFLTTRKLSLTLQTWAAKEMLATPGERADHGREVDSFIQLAMSWISRVGRLVVNDEDYRAMLPESIAASINILISTLDFFKKLLYDIPRYIPGSVVDSRNPFLTHMVVNGWCRGQATALRRKFDSSFVYYASLLGPPSDGKDHSPCTESRCIANDVDEDSYLTQHWKPSLKGQNSGTDRSSQCKCEHLMPDMKGVIGILDSGSIPLISLKWPSNEGIMDGCDDMDLDVVPFEPGAIYVAISHVWSDGMGNPRANSLPECQLRALRRRLMVLWLEIANSEGGSLRTTIDSTQTPLNPERLCFWMDTLCVPLAPKSSRKAAILAMKRSYSFAKSVLVLDASLMTQTSNSPAPELLARITISNWQSRLWTLQEAVMAENVFIQLSDGVLDFYKTSFQFLKRKKNPSGLVPEFDQAFLSLATQFRSIKHSTVSAIWGRATKLYSLAGALHSRTTSHSSDEAICIGHLLGLRLDPILTAEEDEERWIALLWEMRELLPARIIFLHGWKMERNGYRWAPASFLVPRSAKELTYTIAGDGEAAALIREVGIMVKFPGIVIQLPEGDRDLEIAVFDFWLHEEGTPVRFCIITYFHMDNLELLCDGFAKLDEMNPPPMAPFGAVFDGPFNRAGGTRAAVVSDCVFREDGTISSRYICGGYVFPAQSEAEGSFMPDELHEAFSKVGRDDNHMSRQTVQAEAKGSEQIWCIS